jgi:hypothetical protein
MKDLLLAARAIGQGAAVVKVTPEKDGSIIVTTTPYLTRKQAADYLGMGLNAFIELKLARRGTGHKPFHIEELDKYIEHQKHRLNDAKAYTD